jgi:hypothetical protein
MKRPSALRIYARWSQKVLDRPEWCGVKTAAVDEKRTEGAGE